MDLLLGKKVYKPNTVENYWLIDLIINYTSSNTFGDTIMVNGTTYSHLDWRRSPYLLPFVAFFAPAKTYLFVYLFNIKDVIVMMD